MTGELSFGDAVSLAGKLLLSFVVTPVDLAQSMTIEVVPIALERTTAAHEARQFCVQEHTLAYQEAVHAQDWAPAQLDATGGPEYPTLPEVVGDLIDATVEERSGRAEELESQGQQVVEVVVQDPAVETLRPQMVARHAEELHTARTEAAAIRENRAQALPEGPAREEYRAKSIELEQTRERDLLAAQAEELRALEVETKQLPTEPSRY